MFISLDLAVTTWAVIESLLRYTWKQGISQVRVRLRECQQGKIDAGQGMLQGDKPDLDTVGLVNVDGVAGASDLHLDALAVDDLKGREQAIKHDGNLPSISEIG